MERSVEIDACFSNVVDAAIDITVACKGSKKKSAHSEVLMDTSQTFDEGTLKRAPTAPRLELSQGDLIRLLSYLEGELQARDIVIATLKSEKAKQLLYQAKYGHLNLNDPLSALQRDSELCGENEDFDESSIGRLYENQLGYLERLVGIQRRSHQHAKKVLSFVEKRHERIVRQLEQERQWRAEDVVQGDNICVILVAERERMQEELEQQKRQCRQMQLALVQMQEAMTKEKERHKSIVQYLHQEYERLLTQMQTEYEQKFDSRETLVNGFDHRDVDSETDDATDMMRHEIRILREQLESEKRQVLGLKQIVKLQEDELTSVRTSVPPTYPSVTINTKVAAVNGRANGDVKNGMQRSFSDATSDSTLHSAETTIGVDLKQPQQLFHASGVFRRSTIASSSPSQTKNGGVLSAAKNYIFNAAKSANDRRLSSSVSPPLKRWTPGLVIANENASTASSTHSAPAPKTSNGNLESPPTNQEKADDRPKPHFTSIITRPPRDEVEPEIAELEAVLKSLAMATSLTNGNGNGNVHFPDVEDIPIVNGGEKKENGVTKAEEEKETKKANGTDSQSNGTIKNHTTTDGSIPNLTRSNSTNSGGTNDTSQGKAKKYRPARIPIGINRKLSKQSNGQEPARASSTSADQLHEPSAPTEKSGTTEKALPLGCSSPHMALQRKVKAISGLANRIQRRVVAGVVNQVAIRPRPAGAEGS